MEKAGAEHRDILNAVLDPEDPMGIRAYLAVMRHMESTQDIMLPLMSGGQTG